jgi:tricorn protease
MPGYLRHPTLNGDQIAFVADDDLWTVAAAAAVARRLTAGPLRAIDAVALARRPLARLRRPRRAPSGGARDAGRRRPVAPPHLARHRRAGARLDAGGEIVYVTTHGQPFFRNHQAFAVAPEGGRARPLGLGQVNHIAFGEGGRVAIGRNTDDPARWKRYRGGRAGAIWVDAEGSGSFRRLDSLAGNVTTPMWIGAASTSSAMARASAISIRASTTAATCAATPTTTSSTRARRRATAAASSTPAVRACGCSMPRTDATRELAIETPAHRAQAARRFVPSTSTSSGSAASGGHSLAVVARGQLFAMPLWEGAPTRRDDAVPADAATASTGAGRAPASRPVARRRPDHDRGERRLGRGAPRRLRRRRHSAHAAMGLRPCQRAGRGAGRATSSPSPTIATRSGSATSRAARSAPSTPAATAAATTSPGRADGAWLAYTFHADTRHVAIKLFERASGSATWLTEPEFRDSAPAFDPEGRYLYFLSVRTFDPVYDNVRFDLSFPRGARPYLIALRAGARAAVRPGAARPRRERRCRRQEGRQRSEGRDRAAAHRSRRHRPSRRRLPGARGTATAASPASPAARSSGTTQNLVGAHGRGGHKEAAGKLERFDFATGRSDTLVDKVDDFALAADGRDADLPRGQEPARDRRRPPGPSAGPSPAKAKARHRARTAGSTSIASRIAVEPRREWSPDAARGLASCSATSSGRPSCRASTGTPSGSLYAPLLDRVATRADLSDLVWEMQGELGTSHAYEMGGDHRKPPAVALGHLACASRWDAVASAASRSPPSPAATPGDASADSPLNAIGVEARVGDVIVAVGGEALGPAGRPRRCSSIAPARKCS